ncbi:MAG: sulfur carrier protein ThiS [Planctomycetaceae bacterium]|nr:sulfur carrier protein ThiS [Planctomycetaceae bacterium]
MRIIVNGEARDVAAGTSVGELLVSLNIRTRAVAVERNLEIVPSAHHAECVLSEGDQLEIVTLVGGG